MDDALRGGNGCLSLGLFPLGGSLRLRRKEQSQILQRSVVVVESPGYVVLLVLLGEFLGTTKCQVRVARGSPVGKKWPIFTFPTRGTKKSK